MWLWRGETGLWEKDPAMPVNFRGNLLGIAFDPNDTARGYAVGQQGVLLRYGKSWTQEPEEAIPPAAQRSELHLDRIRRIGSYRGLAQDWSHPARTNTSRGDPQQRIGLARRQGAAAVLGADAVPWAVAGLPDGGAAFTARSPTQGGFVYERDSAGSPWQPSTYPGGLAPGALALFREGGALRAIGTGSEPATAVAEEEPRPRPVSPDPRRPLSAGERQQPRGSAPNSDRMERRGARTQRRPGTPRRLRVLGHPQGARSRQRTSRQPDWDPRLGGRRGGRRQTRAARHSGYLPLSRGRQGATGHGTEARNDGSRLHIDRGWRWCWVRRPVRHALRHRDWACDVDGGRHQGDSKK